ncbi:MAG TPA: hypothetical protein VG326_18465 [Tepidisphaeraceae bacterium]|jgi:hypothetical protein|nr:hypothetical protein [Tepidisphaeraceae bacterium]
MRSRFIYLAAAILTATAIYACWCRAPMIWDGAYQFNATLIMQRPYFYLTRFHTFFLWWPTVWASRITSDVDLLQTIYGLPFLLAPVVGLLLSWWMVHKHSPQLILWAIFGIAAGALPGQIFVINDSIFQQHLFWPIFMSVFVPLSIPRKITVGVLAVFQMVHPIGILLLFAAAGAALLVGVVDPLNRRRMFIRAGVMSGLCILAAGKVFLTSHIQALQSLNDTYAQQEASWHTALDRWYAGVMGWPLRGLWCMWTAGAVALLYRRPRGQFRPLTVAALSAMVLLAGAICVHFYRVHPSEAWYPMSACVVIYLSALLMGDRADIAAIAAAVILLGAGYYQSTRYVLHPLFLSPIWIARAICAVLVLFLLALRRTTDPAKLAGGLMLLCVAVGAGLWTHWAADGRLWWKALDYRRWLAPLTAPFFLLAAIEASLMIRSKPDTELASPEETRPLRGVLAIMLAATFAVVLGLQSTIWRHETSTLMAAVERAPSIVVSANDLRFIPGTPLDHWGSGDYVMAMQGKRPSKLLLFDREAEEKLYEHPPKPPHWDMYPYAKANQPSATPGPQGWFDLRPLLEKLMKTSGPTMQEGPQRMDAKTTPN